MLVINYNGNKPTFDYYKFSVQGNNNADRIRFLISLNQEGCPVFDEENYHYYAKVQCVDDDFYDKVELSDVTFNDFNNSIQIDFVLERKHTVHKQIEVSLCCEDLNNEIVWQTQLVKVAIARGILCDEEIENNYPTVLAQLQEQIDEILKTQGGGSNEIEIKKVWLSYDDGKSIRADLLGTPVDSDGEYFPFVNDATRIWVNFETSPISQLTINEIKNGRFVIRLDYPRKNHSRLGKVSEEFVRRTTTHKDGVGTRTFAKNFLRSGAMYEMSQRKKNILLNSLIFVNEEDIKTNVYGEKYIHKKVSFFDYVNHICAWNNESELVQPITNDWIRNTETGRNLFNDFLDNRYVVGIPHLHQTNLTSTLFKGRAVNKYYAGHTSSLSGTTTDRSQTNSIKLNPAFTCYSMMKASFTPKYIYSPYFISNHKINFYDFFSGSCMVLQNTREEPATKKVSRKAYMSARPRCAILNDDYETSDDAFIKTYKQSDQQIKLMCKSILGIGDYDVDYAPIFRMIITQK